MRKSALVLFLIVLMAVVIAVPVGAQPSVGNSFVPKSGITSPGTIRGFDPQPEPPALIGGNFFTTGLQEVSLNPQPLPPAEASLVTPGTMRGFNPQPDPPHDPFRIGAQFGDGSV